MAEHLTTTELLAGLAELGQSPQDNGRLEMIVCRLSDGQRLILEQAALNPVDGLMGDNWRGRGSKRTEDDQAHPEMQIAIINSRFIQLLARDRSRWPLAGDQLFLDLDLSFENLPAGQLFTIGTAVLEITSMPHTGCGNFTERYGQAATRLVNSAEGRSSRRRGIYARVIQAGVINVGDRVTKTELVNEQP